MFIRKIFLAILLIITVPQAGCKSAADQAAITGVIAHNHPMEIPLGYKVNIQIEDITKADTPGKSIAQKVIESQGDMLPMPFEVVYDPDKINADHTYDVKVTIEDSTGAILYTNNSIVPVITHGNPTQHIEVDVILSG
jgi:putative lipoprotein